MKKDSTAENAARFVVNLWRYRTSNRIRAIVEDTIDILYKETKPLIIKAINESHFILSIPPGCNFKTFKDKLDYFSDALGYDVYVEKKGCSIHMKVLTEPIQTMYPFDFDYENAKGFLPFPVGYSAKGLLIRDLARFPFMLVGGVPDAGKSNFIHVILTSLLVSRANCYITVFDFKKTEYSMYMRDHGLLVTDESKANEVLYKMNEELDRRNQWLSEIGEVKIHGLEGQPPFLFFAVDELTELQNKDSQLLLNRVLRLGRNSGFTGVLGTQKPSAKTFRDGTFTETRSLCDARMCFRVKSGEDSKMILNNANGVNIPAIRGRGIFQWDDEIEVQTLFMDPKKIMSLVPNKRERVIIFDSNENDQPQKMLRPRQ
ncbi:hypothetical protein BHU72_14840 [Desulfuribacillus stibiiarsenatis]|uniref:FtsK domain-containing protein n=1 Tax=Desulfuribacillus stibiiarsenatis TaxID=1390249 RepID=A0A1E5L7A0_9FIRM|nr:FtsK/SpoIIIE domain-containing protein [Desulfuribacillus stibiiarsenatis]OEH86027.1 hypothetical protein BHU72_14840 [Desulfuribacillus stibiiarsenatis]